MKFNEIKTRSDLANFLKIPQKKLSYILYIKGIDNLYTSFEIPKKNGGIRNIHAPTEDLKSIQQKISQSLWEYHQYILKENNIKSNISHAFQKEKSILTNAKIHRNKRYVLNIDLENFFESFHFGRVKGYFEKNKFFLLSKEIATILAQLTCYQGYLPQGAPSSPVITNLICNTLDMKLIKLTNKYKLDYTRYADDLTFSTNNKDFLEKYPHFFEDLIKIVNKSGFKINDKKTRLQYKDSRQEVTGLTVNKKISVDRNYYKKTRSMAHSLYTKGEFMIDGEIGTINQLEGRFAFINQVEIYNSKITKKPENDFFNLSNKQKQYQKFLFYKYFLMNSKPVIVTEGKTDIDYIKSALKNLYLEYPNLINKKHDGTFEFNITFLSRKERLEQFLNIQREGADTLKNIYNFYSNKNESRFPNFSNQLKSAKLIPKNPVILILDNEIFNKDKPLNKFANYINLDKNLNGKSAFEANQYCNITSNLYLLTHQLVSNLSECEIEDLFDKTTLDTEISGKTFERDKALFDPNIHYGKAIFANFISKNYLKVNFDNFRQMLNNLNTIIEIHKIPSNLSQLSKELEFQNTKS